MGTSESTARSNGTDEPEEQNNNRSIGDLVTAAVVGAGVIGVAAYGVSRLRSGNSEHHVMETDVHEAGYRYVMSTDASCRSIRERYNGDHVERGPSGYGGILREPYGNWEHAFMGFIDEADVFTAELHGILKGLELLDKLQLKGSTLETDNQAAFQLVKAQDEYRGNSAIVRASLPIIYKCRTLVYNNSIKLKHVVRNDNRCADKLADIAVVRRAKYVEMKNDENLPDELRILVERCAG